jgi:hypothetical protein
MNALQKEIARRKTLIRELQNKSEQRRRESSESFFEFSLSFSIDFTVLSNDEKSSINLSKESQMTDVLTRSSRDVFISMFSSLQIVDVDSFIN